MLEGILSFGAVYCPLISSQRSSLSPQGISMILSAGFSIYPPR